MPELPDIVNYVEALREATTGSRLERIALRHPFLLRTVSPTIDECAARTVVGVNRVGKQIVIELGAAGVPPDGSTPGKPALPIYVALHLMVAGRLAWSPGGAPIRKWKGLLAEFVFSSGTLGLTEAGTKRRAALRLLSGEAALASLDRGGVDLFSGSAADLAAALRAENHTLKRALTDPRLVSGVGNAYSDEILHAARLSPFARTAALTDEQIETLHTSARSILSEWTDRLRAERNGGFPKKVTAFHPAMGVHGKFDTPCPVCGTAVQRIRYAENECNYCPRCQTEGKLYADRAVSRLLKSDWPATIEELERIG